MRVLRAWVRYLTGRCVLCGTHTTNGLCFDCYWVWHFGDDDA